MICFDKFKFRILELFLVVWAPTTTSGINQPCLTFSLWLLICTTVYSTCRSLSVCGVMEMDEDSHVNDHQPPVYSSTTECVCVCVTITSAHKMAHQTWTQTFSKLFHLTEADVKRKKKSSDAQNFTSRNSNNGNKHLGPHSCGRITAWNKDKKEMRNIKFTNVLTV